MKEFKYRKHIRLRYFDYGIAVYFITICTFNKAETLSKIISDQVVLEKAGSMIETALALTCEHFSDVEVHTMVIMPNHIHLIIQIHQESSLSAFIMDFKSRSTVLLIKEVKAGNVPAFDRKIWQPNYYEHVIRNEKDYLEKYTYIEKNPYTWMADEYYE